MSNDATATHLAANSVAGSLAVVACDKPPVGTVAALLEHNVPSVILSDGSIRPGIDPRTGQRIDLVTAFQAASDPEDPSSSELGAARVSRSGKLWRDVTYNTMQTFIGVLGLEPLHMVSPASDDPRRLQSFQTRVDCFVAITGVRTFARATSSLPRQFEMR